ncbi:hypothetical protein CPLU01_01643 [Colletotrichum plurivorum]|uniref:Uncharacterized protein n=1 Tax=Colletotrichum plurivorum TaxID=2175906 RepID=A0A8H6KZA7_9PEZI|nr:hypothetical protein CPLU01_01643 [Colletotrichum plurivorum]
MQLAACSEQLGEGPLRSATGLARTLNELWKGGDGMKNDMQVFGRGWVVNVNAVGEIQVVERGGDTETGKEQHERQD